MKLLSESNTKTVKGEKKGYKTYVLHLSPANLSGYEVCPKRTAGCTAACLNVSGHGYSNRVQEARKRKTRFFFEDRAAFMQQLHKEIANAIKLSEKKGLVPVFRLNGTSDLQWSAYPVAGFKNIFEAFPDVQFYDYTAVTKRLIQHIPNYHLTFSRKESNDNDVAVAISYGANVAVVFENDLPETYMGVAVINGDETDLTFTYPSGVIVGLKAKAFGRKDTTGFVIREAA